MSSMPQARAGWRAAPAAVVAASATGILASIARADSSSRGLAERLWLFAGNFHPLVVHFPIALLLVAAAAEFLRRRRSRRSPAPIARVCLIFGAVSAAIAAALGWSDAITAGHSGAEALSVHRWLGIAAASAALVGAAGALVPRLHDRPRTCVVYRLGLVTSALLVTLTGHFGASLIYGGDYVARAFDRLRPGDSNRAAPSAPTPDLVAVTDDHRSIIFDRDVRPIFAVHCVQCHSGDKPKSGLRLDDFAGALRGGESGRLAIVPGKPEASLMLRLVAGLDDELPRMPPRGEPLSDRKIATLRAWIQAGAKGPEPGGPAAWHWAYRAPERANPPPVKDTYWPRNPIDSFVLAPLESAGLHPSPEADRATLIRRASLDLIGLPPTPEEIDDFLADARSDAYERVVDRLLASPHYGERWARVWLDLARYADTNGYEKDDRRSAWAYRDWVIEALNRDLPFDEFSVKQLAGDLLPDASIDDLIATGFNRNTMTNEEGGVDAEEFRCDSIVDRVNTMSVVWLGSTLQCAQCHDHKYDPFKQEEYYRLFAFFNGDESDVVLHSTGATAAGAMVEVVPTERRRELAATRKEIAALEHALTTPTEALRAEQLAWEGDHARAQAGWTILTPSALVSEGGATLDSQPDGSVLVSGKSPDEDRYTLEVPLPPALASVAVIRLEVLPDPSNGLVGRTPHGNFVLSEFAVTPLDQAGAGSTAPWAIARALADFEQDAKPDQEARWPATGAIDADPKTGWAVAGQTGKPHVALFELASPVEAAALRLVLSQNHGSKHTIARFRIAATAESGAFSHALPPAEIAEVLASSSADRTPEQDARLAEFFRSIADSLAPTRERLALLQKQVAEMKLGTTLVMQQRQEPRDTFLHVRGNFLNHGQQVSPGVPAVLHKLPEQPPGQQPNRLTLARWITDPANPLTARVTVNRFWEHYFGRGIVETSDDFGTQGDPPSHAELLDWLATEFMRQGWSMKAIHRLIVTSTTYRQSSNVSPELLERDPHNRLLARGPRHRLEAEMIRDVALAAGGLLSPKIGGPSVFPPQPEGIWTMIYNDDKWVASTGEDRYRRGLYTFWRRTAPYPTFTSFDAPSREIACARRPRTNTPLQALTILNDPQFVEAAAALAERTLRESPADPRSRLAHAFRLCVARPPTDTEADRLVRLLDDQLAAYRADPDATRALLGSSHPPDTPPPDPSLDPAELAAWILIANVLLNLDETMTKG